MRADNSAIWLPSSSSSGAWAGPGRADTASGGFRSAVATAVAWRESVIVSCSMIIHRTPGFQPPPDGPWRRQKRAFGFFGSIRAGEPGQRPLRALCAKSWQGRAHRPTSLPKACQPPNRRAVRFFWNPTAGRVRLRREHSGNNGRSLLRPADLRGIKTFRCDYAEATPLLLYRGSETLERDGGRCMPWTASCATGPCGRCSRAPPASGTRGRHPRARPRPHAPNNPDGNGP